MKTLLVSGIGVHERGDKTVLEIVGTPGNDTITVTPLSGNRLYVFASFLGGSGRTISAAGLELVKVMGLAGKDFIALSNVLGGVNLPAILDGGDGNDNVTGGNGPNVLLGGRGNDVLMGGPARDILIGGEGADSLFGNGADDILIGGYTNYDTGPIDQKQANDMALLKLLAEWTSGRSNGQRTDNIVNAKGPVLASTGISLKKGLTVFDDAQSDLLSGAAGMDWFFHDARDTVLKTSGEKVNS
jgi:Ca2+-binding RTX toxin-like protein